MEIAARTLIEVGFPLAADCVVTVGPFHVHVLVDLLTKVTTGFFCNRVKSRSSLCLSDYGLKGKVWARRYHARRLAAGDVENARRYILAHATQGAVVMQSARGSTTR
jgi:REP element-mobilizing transposase RayT